MLIHNGQEVTMPFTIKYKFECVLLSVGVTTSSRTTDLQVRIKLCTGFAANEVLPARPVLLLVLLVEVVEEVNDF